MVEEKPNIQLHLAYKRTELAHERTILAHLRTSFSLILFGIAFLGVSTYVEWFLYVGIPSITIGIIFLIIGLIQFSKHDNELKMLEKFVKKVNLRNFNQK